MKAATIGRLQRLEERFASALRGVQPQEAAALPMMVELLERWGVVRGANESLAETFARAMGMNTDELRAELRRRAYGGAAGNR